MNAFRVSYDEAPLSWLASLPCPASVDPRAPTREVHAALYAVAAHLPERQVLLDAPALLKVDRLLAGHALALAHVLPRGTPGEHDGHCRLVRSAARSLGWVELLPGVMRSLGLTASHFDQAGRAGGAAGDTHLTAACRHAAASVAFLDAITWTLGARLEGVVTHSLTHLSFE